MITTEIINSYLTLKFKEEYAIEPIIGLGEVNQVFKVNAQDKTYVLRVNSDDEIDSFIKEKWCYEQPDILSVSVPKILEVTKTNGASFMLMEFVNGENCFNIKDPIFKTEVYKQLGIYVRNLSQTTPEVDIGNLKSVDNAKKWFYNDYLGYEITQISRPDDYLILNTAQRKLIVNSLNILKDTPFDFVLCHGDISLKNCLFSKKSNTLTLIDFGCGETQIKNYFEITLKWLEEYYDKTLTDTDFMVFVSSVVNEDSTKWLESNIQLIKTLALVYTLDKYRWAHDRSSEKWGEEYKTRFYKVLELLS